MQLFALGLNHHTAPLAIREQVAFRPERLVQALADFVRAQRTLELENVGAVGLVLGPARQRRIGGFEQFAVERGRERMHRGPARGQFAW